MEPLVVAASLDSLSDIGQYVLRAAERFGLTKRHSYRLRLAVDEIATNIIQYGYEAVHQSGDLTLYAEITQDTLVVTLEDDSPPFDPRSREPDEQKNTLEPLDLRPIGGLGILLGTNAVDHFDYQSVDGHNRSTFVMRRDRSGGEIAQDE